MKKTLVALLLSSVLIMPSVQAAPYQADFDNVDMATFIDTVSKTLNENIVVSAPLKGKVTFSAQDLSEEQYLTLFKMILRANGYRLIDVGGIKKVVDIKEKELPDPGSYRTQPPISEARVVTRELNIHNVPVTEVSAALQALAGDNGTLSVTPIASANRLVISGFADQVERARLLAMKMDGEQGKNTDVIPLRYASSADLSRVLTNMIGTGEILSRSSKAMVSADARTNSLLVSGNAESRARLRTIIRALDQRSDFDANDGVVYLKYAKSDVVEEVMAKLLKAKDSRYGDVTVVSAKNINAVVISAPKDKLQEVTRLIQQLDVRRAQVYVEAMIVEVSDADGINFGVQWGDNKGSIMQFANGQQLPIGALTGALQQAKPTLGNTVVSENGVVTENPNGPGDLSALMALLNGYNGTAISVVKGNWTALIQAMKSSTHANILSTPGLTTMDNEPASFMVGQTVPLLTGSTASADNKTPFQTIDRRDIGTKLTITPQINEGEAVQLKINAEVSQLQGSTGLDVIFAERKLDTTVLVNDGSMIILGGLIDKQDEESNSKVPILGDIPILGYLFSSHSRQSQKRNLMIFIRPTIIRDGVTSDGITQKKYAYIHAQQVLEQDKDVQRDQAMNDSNLPEINAFNQLIKARGR